MARIYRAPNGKFALTIPDNWECSVESQSVAFYDPAGVGALNVSTLRSPNGVKVKAEDMILNFVSKDALETGRVRSALCA